LICLSEKAEDFVTSREMLVGRNWDDTDDDSNAYGLEQTTET